MRNFTFKLHHVFTAKFILKLLISTLKNPNFFYLTDPTNFDSFINFQP